MTATRPMPCIDTARRCWKCNAPMRIETDEYGEFVRCLHGHPDGPLSTAPPRTREAGPIGTRPSGHQEYLKPLCTRCHLRQVRHHVGRPGLCRRCLRETA